MLSSLYRSHIVVCCNKASYILSFGLVQCLTRNTIYNIYIYIIDAHACTYTYIYIHICHACTCIRLVYAPLTICVHALLLFLKKTMRAACFYMSSMHVYTVCICIYIYIHTHTYTRMIHLTSCFDGLGSF